LLFSPFFHLYYIIVGHGVKTFLAIFTILHNSKNFWRSFLTEGTAAAACGFGGGILKVEA
tara:strand:- start:1 stop:180 length:180 start_codon:yes stop_codon:yes gene_type:complete